MRFGSTNAAASGSRGCTQGAVDESRRTLKPEIPTTGDHGIPLRDELELEMRVTDATS